MRAFFYVFMPALAILIALPMALSVWQADWPPSAFFVAVIAPVYFGILSAPGYLYGLFIGH